MNNEFLENKNFSYLINFVRNDIKQKADYDILENKKYISLFKKLIQTIHTSNMNKRVTKEYLNTIVIDKCVPFLVKQISEDNKKDVVFNIQTPPIQTFDRPTNTRVVRKKKNSDGRDNSRNNNDFSNLTLDNSFNNDNNNSFDGINNRQQPNAFLDNTSNSNPINN